VAKAILCTVANWRLLKRRKIRHAGAKAFDGETSAGKFCLRRKAAGLIEIGWMRRLSCSQRSFLLTAPKLASGLVQRQSRMETCAKL